MLIRQTPPDTTCHVWIDPSALGFLCLTLRSGHHTETHYLTAEEALQLSQVLLTLSLEVARITTARGEA